MRAPWLFPIASFVLTGAASPALADTEPGPARRSFFLFGPPIGLPPAMAGLPPPPQSLAASPAILAGSPDVCRQAARVAGRAAGLPDGLLGAVARVESGRPDSSGRTSPWPWSINVQGIDHVYDSKQEAIAAVLAFKGRGMRSIDVGCLQVNLMYHPNAFGSLELAFDPLVNATYAARFLTELRDATGTWERAVADYHSANPELGEPYKRKVMAVLAEEKRIAAGLPLLAAAPPSGGLPGANPGGGMMLSNNAGNARVLPLPANTPPGRDLGAYRTAPIQITGRALPAAPRIPAPARAGAGWAAG